LDSSIHPFAEVYLFIVKLPHSGIKYSGMHDIKGWLVKTSSPITTWVKTAKAKQKSLQRPPTIRYMKLSLLWMKFLSIFYGFEVEAVADLGVAI